VYQVAAAFRAPVLNFSSEPSSLPPTSTHAPSQGGFYGRDNSNAPSPVRSVRSSLDGRYSEQGGGGYGMGGMRGNGRSGHGGGGSNYGGGGSGSVQGRERQLAAPNGMPRRSYGVSSSAASSSSAVGVGMVGVGTTWSEAELLRDVLYAFQVSIEAWRLAFFEKGSLFVSVTALDFFLCNTSKLNCVEYFNS